MMSNAIMKEGKMIQKLDIKFALDQVLWWNEPTVSCDSLALWIEP